jgi:hypothetical protein
MPHKVTAASGTVNIELPNGSSISAGQSAVLTDEQFSHLPSGLFPGTLIDNGLVGASGDAVTTQAPVVAAPVALTSAAPAAITSSQNATAAATDLTTSEALANALKANYNQAQADIAAMRTNQGLIQADVAALRTTVAAILTALKTAGGPMAAS